MSFNVELMNLFIGMTRGVAGLPRDLAQLGYITRCIEFRFANGAGEQVHPELILSSGRLGHSLLLEWKSGPNTEADQLRRYAGVTARSLRANAYLRVEECRQHDITVVGRAEHEERIAIGVERFNFVLLMRTDEGLRRVRNAFAVPELNEVINPVIAVDWSLVPRGFFPVDDSSELWEFAQEILPTVLIMLGNRDERIVFTNLARQVFKLWDSIDANYQGRLREKILNVMNLAIAGPLNNLLRANRAARGRIPEQTWDVIDNPLIGTRDQRSAEWRRMRRTVSDFVRELREQRLQQTFEFQN